MLRQAQGGSHRLTLAFDQWIPHTKATLPVIPIGRQAHMDLILNHQTTCTIVHSFESIIAPHFILRTCSKPESRTSTAQTLDTLLTVRGWA